MTIINNRFLQVTGQVQNQSEIKQEENPKEKNQTTENNTSDSSNGQKPSSQDIAPQTSVSSLDSNLILTYRGINIDHIETAGTRSSVVSSTVGIQQATKTISATVPADIVLKTSIASDYKSAQSRATSTYSTRGSAISQIKDMANDDLNIIANTILAEAKRTMGEYYDEVAVKKAIDEAIQKTLDDFESKQKSGKSTSYRAQASDDCFVFSRMLLSSRGKYSYNVESLSNAMLKNYNEIAAKNIQITVKTPEPTPEPKPEPTKEPVVYKPSDYFIEKTNAGEKALGKAYYQAETKRVQGNETNLSVSLNKSALEDLQKTANELRKELKAKLGDKYNSELVESLIKEAINKTIEIFDENKKTINYDGDLKESDKKFSVVKAYVGTIVCGSYNVKALVDTFTENFNKQILTGLSLEDLIKPEPAAKYDGNYLLNRYSITDNIRKLYFDQAVEPNGTFSYSIKDEYKNLKPAEIRNDCFQKVNKSLIVQNYVNGKHNSSNLTAIIKTQNGTVLNASNFHLFMDEITLYTESKNSLQNKQLIQKFQNEFVKGEITFNSSGAIANALGAENIKQVISGDNYSLSFKFQGEEYNLLCTRSAGLNGADDKKASLHSKVDIDKYNLPKETVEKYFYKAIAIDGEVIKYGLKEGMTIKDFEQEIESAGLQNTYQTYSEKYAKAFSDQAEFASVFESAKKSAMEQVTKNNVTEEKDVLFIFDKTLSTSVNNKLWENHEKETAQAQVAAKSSISLKNNKQSGVVVNKTFPSKDGGTITINYQGVFANGILVTNPNSSDVNCNIIFTDKNGNKTTIPFNIGLDLLPEENKKALEEWEKSEYYYTGDPTYLINSSNGKYYQGDFYTQQQWFDLLIGHITKGLSELSEEAINVLKDKKPTLSVQNKNNPAVDAEDALGAYNNATNSLSLYTEIDRYNNSGDFYDLPFNPYVITHELGHAQDYKDGQSQSGKLFSSTDEWVKFTELIPEDLSAYAFRNVKEFFAEYFAYKNTPSGSNVQNTTGKKSIQAFRYLENELQKSPNSELSKIYSKVKENLENIRNSKPITNNTGGIKDDKKFTNEELIEKIKNDWTNDKINLGDIGGDWSDIALALGVNMQTKDILAEYYKHHYLNEPSDIINKLNNATGKTQYGDSVKELWNNIQKSSPYGNGLKDACEDFQKKIDESKSDPYIDTDVSTEEPQKNELFVSGTINVKNVKGFIQTGDGLFIQANSKGEFTSDFYENAVNAAIQKYGEGLNITFSANSDGSISYTIDNKNNNGKVTNYVVIDSKSGYILQGQIDNSALSNLTSVQKSKFENYAKNHSLEEMMSQNLSAQFDYKSQLPTKLTPVLNTNIYTDPKTGKIDAQALLQDVFLKYADVYKVGNGFNGYGDSAGQMYLALVYSLTNTGSIDSAIDAFNNISKQLRQTSWTGSATEDMFNNMGGMSHDRIGESFIGFALLSDTFASFNKVMLSKQGMSYAEMEAMASGYANYMKKLTDCLKNNGGGGGGASSGTVDKQFMDTVQKIFKEYKDPTERMIAIINASGFDSRITEFGKKIKEQLNSNNDKVHGPVEKPGSGSGILDEDYCGGKLPPIIVENPKDEVKDPFAKPDLQPIKKY